MIHQAGVLFGTDPELFFATTGGVVVGAEKILPKSGKLNVSASSANGRFGEHNGGQEIVLDGVQVELHLNPSWCRAHLGNELRCHFQRLRTHLEKMKGTSVSFEAVVRVDQAELASLSEKSRTLGCAPSLNLYDPQASIKVDPATYSTRSAGGHLHFGLLNSPGGYHYGPFLIFNPEGGVDQRERVVPILDILLGNTAVLLDRNPLAAERRKVYGRAGEYRLPKHGLEYRTLSNFWLRSYQLLGLVLGLGRMAVSVVSTSIGSKNQHKAQSLGDPEGKLLKMVDLDKVRRAINTNSLELAKENWQKVREFIQTEVHGLHEEMGVGAETLPEFEYFLKLTEERGLDYWFPVDPMEHWCNLPEGHRTGFEAWLKGRVRPQFLASMNVSVPEEVK